MKGFTLTNSASESQKSSLSDIVAGHLLLLLAVREYIDRRM